MRRGSEIAVWVVLGAVALAAPPVVAQSSAPGAAEDARGTDSPFWAVLSDTTLNRLMEEARRGNHDLRAATAREDGAAATRLEAALGLVPAVTASAGYTRRRLASATFPGVGIGGALPDQGLWDSGLSATWELDVFGRLRSRLDARNEEYASAAQDLRGAEVSLAADLARSYFELRGAQDQLAVARRNLANQQRTLDLTRSRLEAGRGTEFDTERARAQLGFTLAAVPLLESRIAVAQYRIAVLVGRPPHEVAAELSSEGSLPELPEGVPSIDPAGAVRERPDVRAAEARAQAAEALVSSARADYLPRVSLVAGAGYTASAVDAFGNSGTFSYAFGPVISWAAFDMGRVKARVDDARALEVEARARYEQVELLAREEMAAATVRYRSARARLAHLREAARASEKAASLAALRYEGGVADFLQVLDAERTMLAAQDQLAQGRTEAVDAYVALYEALGATWPFGDATGG